jgi:Na+/H+ antiporter NhaC
MFRHSTNALSFISVLIAVLIFSLSLAGVAAAQTNTSLGAGALVSNTTSTFNSALGFQAALFSNTTGSFNTASGVNALPLNTTGGGNRLR